MSVCQALSVMMIGVLGVAMVVYIVLALGFFGVCISGLCGSLCVCLGSGCVLLWCTAGPYAEMEQFWVRACA